MAITPLDDALLPKRFRGALEGRWPLWYYVLKEAEIETGGEHLGAVGGRIVAEVLAGLLAGDPLSYLSVDPTWSPTLPGRRPRTFTLTDLVDFGLRSLSNRPREDAELPPSRGQSCTSPEGAGASIDSSSQRASILGLLVAMSLCGGLLEGFDPLWAGVVHRFHPRREVDLEAEIALLAVLVGQEPPELVLDGVG